MTEVTEAARREINIASARNSFQAYMTYVHETDMPWVEGGRAVPARHMMPLIEKYEKITNIILRRIEGWQAWQGVASRHTSVVAPPGSAKTTLTQYYMEWLLGQASLAGGRWANTMHLAFISSSEDQSLRVSFGIKETIKSNEAYHLVFPKVTPSPDKWADGEWRVKGCTDKDPTFQAQGRRGSIMGSRLNFVAVDDLIKQEEVKEGDMTLKEIKEINNVIRLTFLPRLVPMGCMWSNHTRWTEQDPPGAMKEWGWEEILVQGLVESQEKSVLQIQEVSESQVEVSESQSESAGSEGGTVAVEPAFSSSNSLVSYWPERFTTEELLAIKKSDPEGFALQYMGLPAPEEGIDFKVEMLSYDYSEIPWKDAEDMLNYAFVDSWDTAGTLNPRSDFTAGWTAAIDLRSWDIYLLNLFHAKLEFP